MAPQEYSKFSDEGASKRLKFTFAPFSPVKLAADIAAITGMKAQHAGVEVVVRPPLPHAPEPHGLSPEP